MVIGGISSEILRIHTDDPTWPGDEYSLTVATNLLRLVWQEHPGGALKKAQRARLSGAVVMIARVLRDGAPRQRGGIGLKPAEASPKQRRAAS
jgi:hypothetical protein